MTRQLAFVLYPDFQLLDAAGPVAAFEMANRYVADAYRVTLVSRSGGLIKSSSGIELMTAPFAGVGAVDTLLVVGGEGVLQAAECATSLAFIGQGSRQARRLASVCSGALLLAAAGLLDGRKATTHWRWSTEFARRFPAVSLDADRIYINDGNVWTSAGISAGIDLALALITEDLGEKVARQAAQQLVVYYRRPGGQSQYSALLEMSTGQGRFESLLDHIRSNLAQPLMVNDLAAQACISPRHFARLFTAEVGTTPARAVERLRVEAASAALESGGGSLQRIAAECGFSDAEQMRRAFIRLKGLAPSAIRQH